MKQYLDLMRHVRENGVFKDDRRVPEPIACLGIKCASTCLKGFP